MCAQRCGATDCGVSLFLLLYLPHLYISLFFNKKNSQSGAYSLYSSTAANRGPVYLVGSLSRDRLEVRLGMDIVMIHLRTFLAFNVTR